MTESLPTYSPGCACASCKRYEEEHRTFLYTKDVPPAVATILNDIQRLPMWQYLVLARVLNKLVDD